MTLLDPDFSILLCECSPLETEMNIKMELATPATTMFASNESFTHRAHSSNLSSADSEFQVLKPTADTESSAVTGLSAEEIRDSSQEKPSKRASLCDLPNELLGSIEQYISVVDACCVAICNRRLKQAFGYRYDECMSKPSMKNERGNFLALIAADFSAYFYCDVCQLLHRTDMARPLGSKNLTTYQWISDARTGCM